MKNFFLLLITLLITLTVGEVIFRILDPEKPKVAEAPRMGWVQAPERVWSEYHPKLGWYHQKNKSALLQVHSIDVTIHTNAQGFRGIKDYAPEKTAGKTRVLMLGDSFTFGFGVKDDETFSSRLEAIDPNLEVINLGVSGYGIDQLLVAYREIGRTLKPNIVFINVFPEMFWRATRAFADTGHAKPYFSLSGNNQLLLHNSPVPVSVDLNATQFPGLVPHSAAESVLLQSKLYRAARKAILHLARKLKWVDPDLDDEWILGRAILKELVTEIRKEGGRPILLLVPPKRWAETSRKDTLRRSLLRFAQKENLWCIDLTPIFFEAIQKGSLEDFYISGDWHWTAKGHELAAQNIRESYS